MTAKNLLKDIFEQKCSVCKEIKQKIRMEKYVYKNKPTGSYFRDKNGVKWNGTQCGDCANKLKLKKNYEGGKRTPIDLITNPSIKKGRDSESIVQKYFEKLGYKVLINKCHGTDITIFDKKTKKKSTVEVKSVVKHNIANCWYVNKVRAKRKNDDLIAIVFPNNKIHIESMKSHLLKCNNGGNRTVTGLLS